MKKEPGQDKRLEKVKDWQKRLDSQYAKIAEKRKESQKFLEADPDIVDVLEGRSKVTTNDMQDAIDMAMPEILETIAGIDEPLKLDPDEAKWVEPVRSSRCSVT